MVVLTTVYKFFTELSESSTIVTLYQSIDVLFVGKIPSFGRSNYLSSSQDSPRAPLLLQYINQ